MLTVADKGTLFLLDMNPKLEVWLKERYFTNDDTSVNSEKCVSITFICFLLMIL